MNNIAHNLYFIKNRLYLEPTTYRTTIQEAIDAVNYRDTCQQLKTNLINKLKNDDLTKDQLIKLIEDNL